MKNTKQANKFMMFFLLFQFVAMFIFVFITLSLKLVGKTESEIMQYLLLSQDFVIFVLPMAAYLILTGIPLKEILPLKRLSGKNTIYVIIITVLSIPMSSAIASITSMFTSTEVNTSFVTIILECPVWLSFLFMVIMPAVFEESMFRGFILTGYKRSGVMKAVFVSALYFGMMHLDLYQLPYATFMGIIMAALVYYTGSIYASMLAHFIINGWQTGGMILMKFVYSKEEILESMNYVSTVDEQIGAMYTSVTFMVVALPFLLYFMSRFIKRNRANSIEYCTGYRAIDAYAMYDNPEKSKCVDKFFVINLIIYIVYMFIKKL